LTGGIRFRKEFSKTFGLAVDSTEGVRHQSNQETHGDRQNVPNLKRKSPMSKAAASMIANLKENTGRSLEEWNTVIAKKNLAKHGEIVKFLKEEHQVTHGYAAEIALKFLGSDAASASDTDELLETQYKGKEHLKPIYEKLIAEVQKFGSDFEAAPKKAYVSLKRKKQFVTLTPASKTRFEIGFNLKGIEPEGRLQAEKPNGICSHKISVTDIGEIDAEVIAWVKLAFDKAG
jgi:predicted transport protein